MGEHGRERQLCLSEIIELVRTRVRDRRIGDPRNREKRGLALQVFDWQRQMKRRGLQRDTVYLVRPDGYPAVAAPLTNQTEALTSYLDKHNIHLADVKAGDRVRISWWASMRVEDLFEDVINDTTSLEEA